MNRIYPWAAAAAISLAALPAAAKVHVSFANFFAWPFESTFTTCDLGFGMQRGNPQLRFIAARLRYAAA